MRTWISNQIQLNLILSAVSPRWNCRRFYLTISYIAYTCKKYRANYKHDITNELFVWVILLFLWQLSKHFELSYRKYSPMISNECSNWLNQNFILVRQFISVRLIIVVSLIEMNQFILCCKFVELIHFIMDMKTIKQTDLIRILCVLLSFYKLRPLSLNCLLLY